MDMNAVLFAIVGVVGCAMLLAYVLRYFGVPAAVAYIVTGLVAGPSGLALIEDQELLRHIGEIGVIMLLFFIGMEVSLPRLIAGWRIAVLGTIAQMALSVGICSLVSWMFGWPWQAGLLFGFIISMSSTAVVLTMLKDSGELNSSFGQNALGVLLMQDMAIVPIMIILGMMGEAEVSLREVSVQVIGGILLVTLAFWLMRKPGWHIPESLKLTLDRKIMMGLLLCFSSAALTSWIGLSAPFGAFLAGMILNASDQAEWVEEHLRSLYVVFVAIFFMSVGMLVDIPFILGNLGSVALVTFAVFFLNSGINTLVLRTLGETWTMSLLTGGLLSQIGELSFLLASLGVSIGLLNAAGHQMAIAVIALSLMLSPFWMLAIRYFVREDTQIMVDQDIDAEVKDMAHMLEMAQQSQPRGTD
ncbi:MAG TPA: cation:proton antiporter [Mariprofundaceae bacterium]|nr:cation:proton antiporter [Mariprofundaceae bacterium]